MSNDAIYLVVKETGDYSDWSKDNIAYYTSYEAAKAYVDLHESIEAIKDMHRPSSYSIEVIQPGQPITNAAELIAEATAERDRIHKELIEAEETKLADIKAKMDAATSDHQRDVYEFLLWWEGGTRKDPHFYSKTSARLRGIEALIKQYVVASGDKMAAKWMATHGHLLTRTSSK